MTVHKVESVGQAGGQVARHGMDRTVSSKKWTMKGGTMKGETMKEGTMMSRAGMCGARK